MADSARVLLGTEGNHLRIPVLIAGASMLKTAERDLVEARALRMRVTNPTSPLGPVWGDGVPMKVPLAQLFVPLQLPAGQCRGAAVSCPRGKARAGGDERAAQPVVGRWRCRWARWTPFGPGGARPLV